MGLHHNKVLVLHLEVGGVLFYYKGSLGFIGGMVVDCIVCHNHYLDITDNVVAL